MEDDELAVLKAGEAEFYDIKNDHKIDKELQVIEWSIDAAEKGGYKHFMLKEIYEEPTALKQTMLIPKEKILKSINRRWGNWKKLAAHYIWTDLFWRHQQKPVPWLEKEIRL